MGGFGGGIQNLGGGAVTLNSSTVVRNEASNIGGGLRNSSATIVLKNTILGENEAPMGKDCSGVIDSAGYNLIGNPAECGYVPATTDVMNVDPLLGDLRGNGGNTETHALLPGSPAIDRGNPDGCSDELGVTLVNDQRGVVRSIGAGCDIGAFERGMLCDLELDYREGTLHLDFELATTDEVEWNLFLTFSGSVATIWSGIRLPEILPEIPFGLQTPFPQLGQVGFLTTFVQRGEGLVCWDFAVVDTGLPQDTPTIEGAREQILRGLSRRR